MRRLILSVVPFSFSICISCPLRSIVVVCAFAYKANAINNNVNVSLFILGNSKKMGSHGYFFHNYPK